MNTFNTKEDGTHLYRFYYVEPIIDIYAYDFGASNGALSRVLPKE